MKAATTSRSRPRKTSTHPPAKDLAGAAEAYLDAVHNWRETLLRVEEADADDHQPVLFTTLESERRYWQLRDSDDLERLCEAEQAVIRLITESTDEPDADFHWHRPGDRWAHRSLRHGAFTLLVLEGDDDWDQRLLVLNHAGQVATNRTPTL